MVPSAAKMSDRSLSRTVSLAYGRRRPAARLAARASPPPFPVRRPVVAPRGDARRGRGGDLPGVRKPRRGRLRLVRRRPAHGVRLPGVPSARLAGRRGMFVIRNSSTGPRRAALLLMARRAGTRIARRPGGARLGVALVERRDLVGRRVAEQHVAAARRRARSRSAADAADPAASKRGAVYDVKLAVRLSGAYGGSK